MLKNILAAFGLYFVAKKGYEHYREYSELKRERGTRKPGEARAGHTDRQQQNPIGLQRLRTAQ